MDATDVERWRGATGLAATRAGAAVGAGVEAAGAGCGFGLTLSTGGEASGEIGTSLGLAC
jgi:hypothetical protein